MYLCVLCGKKQTTKVAKVTKRVARFGSAQRSTRIKTKK